MKFGSWVINENIPEESQWTEWPQPLASAFSGGMEPYVGLKITPLQLLATQIVNGTNYLVLCKVAPTVPNATAYLANVVINCSFDGKESKICSVENLV